MKKLTKILLMAVALTFGSQSAMSQDFGEILSGIGNALGGNSNSGKNGNDGSDLLGNLLEGVFSSSNLTLDDITGVWTTNGPAVCFKSEDFLKSAGGKAAAAAVEQKLTPYYNQYGMNGAVVTINPDNTFSMKMKHVTLSGTVSQITGEKGCFEFTFMLMNSIKVGSFKAYVEKSVNTLNLMFDATKLKSIITTVANFTGISIAKTMASVLDSYDGLCVGFRMDRTGNVPGQTGQTGSSKYGNNKSGNSSNSGKTGNSGFSAKSGNNGSNSNSNSNNNNSGNNNSGNIGSGIDQLLNAIGGKSKKK